MKKTLLLALALGLVGVTSAMAQADLFITGSTAFRQQVYAASTKLFASPPTIFTGTPATGGDSKTGSSAAQWVMTGTPSASLTAVSGTLTIHGLFTGSIQGCQTVESQTKLIFLSASDTPMTNTPTIAFTDCSSTASPYPAQGDYSEEQVAVQPFVLCHSVPFTTISNVSNEQLKYAIQIGRIPLSAWDNKPADHANYVYLLQRTTDSGTHRTELAQENDGFNAPQVIYNYDATNNAFYKATNELQAATGGSSNGVASYGVIGPAGNNGANLHWLEGYVGGGDIKTALGYNNAANQSISYLSMADAQNILSGAANNWSQVMPFDGLWPTAAGPGIKGNTGTNDFSPVCEGYYPCWGVEVVVYPVDSGGFAADQNLTTTTLGDQNTPGTLLGVLDYQTKFSGGTAPSGSLENEILVSENPGPATAIRLSEMVSSRASVGGTIAP